MANLIDTFLNQLTAEEKRDKTREQYGGNLRRFERWLLETHSLLLDEEQVGDVTGLMLTEFYQHLHARGLKVSTRNAYVIALMEFFRFLQNAQVIADNPVRVLHTVKEKKKACDDEHKQYTQAEIEALLSSMEKGDLTRNALRDTAMVALALGSGLRAFELCSLNVSHLSDIQNGTVAVERKHDCECASVFAKLRRTVLTGIIPIRSRKTQISSASFPQNRDSLQMKGFRRSVLRKPAQDWRKYTWQFKSEKRSARRPSSKSASQVLPAAERRSVLFCWGTDRFALRTLNWTMRLSGRKSVLSILRTNPVRCTLESRSPA